MWKDPTEQLIILESMSFLEQGVNKLVLTPNMIKYVEMQLSEKSKEEHMEVISKYYLALLLEFYNVNLGDKV